MSFISNAFGANNGYTVTPGLPAGAQFITQDDNLKGRAGQGASDYSDATVGLNQLAQMLMKQAQGQGPNLANQQLQNATGQNIAAQASLMAGQRGAATNPGLIARQIGMQGAGIQQQAAGQAAQNALAQQLAATQQLGGVYGTAGSLANQFNAQNQNAITANNQLITNAKLGASQANAGIAGQNAQGAGGILGGLANAGGSALSNLFSAGKSDSEGGEAFAKGGEALKASMPKSKIPSHLHAIARVRYPHLMQDGGKVEAKTSSEKAEKSGNSYSNDKIPAMLSEHEIVIPRDIAMAPNAPELAYQFVAKIRGGKRA